METISSKRRVSVPRPVVVFLLRALLVFVAWKILYLTLLLPLRVPDRVLTRFIGAATAVTLNMFGGNGAYTATEIADNYTEDNTFYKSTSMDIHRNGQQTLRVADACNGLELMVLYLGFIGCFPSGLSRKIYFAIGGCLLITVLNILRCAALVQIFVKHRTMLDFSHHFAFTFIVYGLIFVLWFFFTKNLSLNGRKAST